MGKNAIVGQSGGPTSVINASLAGVFESCKNRGADIVYGMCNGVAGLLEERVVDLSTLLTDDWTSSCSSAPRPAFWAAAATSCPTGGMTRRCTKSCSPFWKS